MSFLAVFSFASATRSDFVPAPLWTGKRGYAKTGLPSYRTTPMPDTFVLTPITAVPLFLLLVFCGRGFRQNWKAQGPTWKLKSWAYGLPALAAFLALAFLPMEM